MATKAWDNNSFDAGSDMTPISANYEVASAVKSCSNSSEHDMVKIRRNNISTRIASRPPLMDRLTRTSSDPSSELMYDETTTSNSNSSSLSSSETPGSNNTPEEGRGSKPSYMNPTESIKAKQRPASPCHQTYKIQMHSSADNLQFSKKSIPFSGSIPRRSADSDLYSVHMCKDLYPPVHFDKYDRVRSRLQ